MKRTILLSCLIFLFCKAISQGYWESQFDEVSRLSDSSKFYNAIQLLMDMEREASHQNNDSLLIEIYIKIGGTYGRANSKEDKFGLDYFQLALGIAEEYKLEKLKASSYFGIGAAHQMLRDYTSSIEGYNQALPFYQSDEDQRGALSYIYSNLGLLYSKIHDYDQTSYFFNEALAIQVATKDYYGIGASYSNLGLVALENENLEKALDCYRKSISAYKRVNYVTGLAGSYRWNALTFGKNDELDSAGYYFLKYDSLDHDIFHQEYSGEIRNLKFQRDFAFQEAELSKRRNQLTILIFVISLVLGISGFGYVIINQRKKNIKTVADRRIRDLLQQQEMKTAYALLEGQDKERKRIASELHDNLGSILVTLSMYADSLKKKTKKEDIADITRRISNTSDKANEEVRKISHSLDSGLLKHFGLKTAITQLMEAVEMSKKIKIELELELSEHFSNETGLELYRIIQELVNNSLKHSNCSKIRLELNQIDKEISLIYEDNGKGFDFNNIQKGMGLDNIERRAERLGGDLKVDSVQGQGSTFIIEINSA